MSTLQGNLAAALLRIAAALSAVAVAAAPTPALAQMDPYRQHMENGIKLFQDRNYTAAIVEFEAAYQERPKASPLFNIALAEKALFNYPKAIAALERALAIHRDTMDENDERAALSAIAEMRALLASLTIELSPPNATLLIDGDEQQPSSEARRVVELGPGVHRIGARAEGHVSAEQNVTLVSGARDKVLKLALVQDVGTLTIDAGSEETAIAVDSRFVAYGQWSGKLPSGPHIVQIYGPSGVIYAAQVLVVAGKTQEVNPEGAIPAPGLPMAQPLRAVPPPPPPPPRPATLATSRQGLFALLGGSLLWPTKFPDNDVEDWEANSGGAVTIRAGYRVNNLASFDMMFQYYNVAIQAAAARYEPLRYTQSSKRLGLNLRLMTPGQMAHFVGSLGGGLTYDSIEFNGVDTPDAVSDCNNKCEDAEGSNAFLLLETGVEFDIGGVLLGASLQSYFQSSRGLVFGDNEQEVYDSGPIVYLGGSVHAGYAFW